MIDRTRQLPVHELTGLDLGKIEEKEMLPNGVEVLALSDDTTGAVCRVTAMLPGGTAESPLATVAALSVSQMRQGTSDMSGDEIADRLDTAGAFLQDSTSTHTRMLALSSLTRNAADNIALLASMIADPVYPEPQFSTNAARAAASKEIELQKVSAKAGREAARLIFGEGNPAYRPDMPEQIRSITPDDVRRYNSVMAVPAGMKVFVAGNINGRLLDDVRRQFSAVPVRVGEVPPAAVIPPAPSPAGIYRVEVPDSRQAAINMNIPTIRRDNTDYIDLRIAVTALGGYFGSRLMTRIREDKGYTYGISAVLLGMRETGIVRVVTECDPAYESGVLEETVRELRRMASEPPEGEELLRVQRFMRSSLAAYLDNALTRISYHIDGYSGGYDAAAYYSAQIKAIDAITPERIAYVSARYLNAEDLITVVAGPSI